MMYFVQILIKYLSVCLSLSARVTFFGGIISVPLASVKKEFIKIIKTYPIPSFALVLFSRINCAVCKTHGLDIKNNTVYMVSDIL